MTFLAQSNFRQLPPVWEMAQPFHIDGTGAVGFDADPARWAINHILALILTTPGERVMRPTYGAGVYRFVWENQDPIVEQSIISLINMGLATYEPNINVTEVEFTQQGQFSAIVVLQVSFTVGNSPTTHTFSADISGNQVEITA
jgi:phage baseplate assembly protein W